MITDHPEGQTQYDEDAAFSAAEAARIAALHKTAPERIWLQIDDEADRFHAWEETTWCSDKINATDLEYVRADQVEFLRRDLDIEIAEYRELLRELLVQLCENPGIREDGNAPGHAHQVPGVWDSDNGDLAGKPCAWCTVWARAVANGLVMP